MDDCEQKELLKAVFGESSDSEDFDDQGDDHFDDPTGGGHRSPSDLNHQRCDTPIWERVEGIHGLWLSRNFLSPQHQSTLLSAVLNEGWFCEESHNQAMRFADLPGWATDLSESIHEAVLSCNRVHNSLDFSDGIAAEKVSVLPSDLLWREPLFNQLIVNLYQPGEGICAHVDLMRFEDGIAIVSLESACVMHFSPAGEVSANVKQGEANGSVCAKVPVFLSPGSLVLMSGEARYLWKHEINRKPGFQVWDGQELDQKRRVSVTLRKLCQVE